MTQGKHPERYVLRELTGYGVAVVGGVQAPGTSIYIMDTDERGASPLDSRRAMV